MKKNKTTEIEKRYLAKYLPDDLNKYQLVEVEDLKIITGEDHSHLRLRRKGDKYLLTKKYPKVEGKTGVMVEETINLSDLEFAIFRRLPNTRQIKKRYKYLYKNRIAQIDVWDDDLRGLVIIEFEFENPKEFQNFKTPEFCLKDIMAFEWLAGAMLSGKKFVDMQDQLTGMGYKPIYSK